MKQLLVIDNAAGKVYWHCASNGDVKNIIEKKFPITVNEAIISYDHIPSVIHVIDQSTWTETRIGAYTPDQIEKIMQSSVNTAQ